MHVVSGGGLGEPPVLRPCWDNPCGKCGLQADLTRARCGRVSLVVDWDFDQLWTGSGQRF